MFIRCPTCNNLCDLSSKVFGKSIKCRSCRESFISDIEQLTSFKLPEKIEINVSDYEGHPISDVPVIVTYGYFLPEKKTDKNGQIMITKAMFLKAQEIEMSTGFMDHHLNYAHNRYIDIFVEDNHENTIYEGAIDLENIKSEITYNIKLSSCM